MFIYSLKTVGLGRNTSQLLQIVCQNTILTVMLYGLFIAIFTTARPLSMCWARLIQSTFFKPVPLGFSFLHTSPPCLSFPVPQPSCLACCATGRDALFSTLLSLPLLRHRSQYCLSTLFSNHVRLWSTLNVSDHVSHPCKAISCCALCEIST